MQWEASATFDEIDLTQSKLRHYLNAVRYTDAELLETVKIPPTAQQELAKP